MPRILGLPIHRKCNSHLFTVFSSCLFIGINCHVSLIRFAEDEPSMVGNVQSMFKSINCLCQLPFKSTAELPFKSTMFKV